MTPKGKALLVAGAIGLGFTSLPVFAQSATDTTGSETMMPVEDDDDGDEGKWGLLGLLGLAGLAGLKRRNRDDRRDTTGPGTSNRH